MYLILFCPGRGVPIRCIHLVKDQKVFYGCRIKTSLFHFQTIKKRKKYIYFKHLGSTLTSGDHMQFFNTAPECPCYLKNIDDIFHLP